MLENPSSFAKRTLASLKLPRIPSVGFQGRDCAGIGIACAMATAPRSLRLLTFMGGLYHDILAQDMTYNYPRLHNAMWPGLVGKGAGAEPPIDLDTMLNLTAAAEVDGVKFDGVDLFLCDPHISIDSSDDDLKRLADKIASKSFVIGSLVAPVWPPTGGGSAMGDDEDRKRFLEAVRKGCRIGAKLRQLEIRPYGIVRIDSATSPAEWSKDPVHNQKRIAQTFREAADIA